MSEGEAVDPDWVGYECKSGQILFYYNKITGEHRWACGDALESTINACQLSVFQEIQNTRTGDYGYNNAQTPHVKQENRNSLEDSGCLDERDEKPLLNTEQLLQEHITETPEVKVEKKRNSSMTAAHHENRSSFMGSEDWDEGDEKSLPSTEQLSQEHITETPEVKIEEKRNSSMTAAHHENRSSFMGSEDWDEGDEKSLPSTEQLLQEHVTETPEVKVEKKRNSSMTAVHHGNRSSLLESEDWDEGDEKSLLSAEQLSQEHVTETPEVRGEKKRNSSMTAAHHENRRSLLDSEDLDEADEKSLPSTEQLSQEHVTESPEGKGEKNRRKRKNTNVKAHKCKYCSKTFNTKNYLEKHERIHTGVKPFKCTYCDKAFTLKTNLRKHVRVHTGEKPYKCRYCDKTFAHQRSVKVHEPIHTDGKPYKCTYCNKALKQLGSLKKHERMHTGVKLFPCSYCKKEFSSRTYLNYHKQLHTGVKPYKCTYCDKTFVSHSNRLQHEHVHSDDRPYKCKQCNKTFRRQSYLKTHERIHTGVKPHKCKYCDKAFSERSNRKVHELIHTGVRAYQCTQCNKTFARKANLRLHEDTHTGIKRYHCTYCGNAFTRTSSLQKHERIHTGVKPYKCTYCDQAFARKDALDKHIKHIHAAVKPYQCTAFAPQHEVV